MLILLPPSEGKSAPTRGKRLALHELSFPALTEARGQVLASLVDLCSNGHDPATPLQNQLLLDRAQQTLGLGPTQADEVRRNGRLLVAPTARADALYSGVLYDALDLASLDATARRRASRWLAVTSSLFGLVRPGDRIPAYRLSGDVNLPGVGVVSAHWRGVLDEAVREAAGNGLVVDLRSTTYAAFWRPHRDLAERVATVRVLQQVGTQRKVVSHFNKATKGRLVRALLESGATPGTPEVLADEVVRLGWDVEVQAPGRHGHQLDVIVSEV